MSGGTIGVVADEVSRYSAFSVSLTGLRKDEDWTVMYAMGRNIVAACNKLVREFEGDHLWLQGDDHIFAVDTLQRMLQVVAEHDLDVLVPLMLMRRYPFVPVVYESANEDGRLRVMHTIPPDSLTRVYAAGTGGMLVSRRALDKLGPDPFSYTLLEDGDLLGEDLTFSARLREAGIPIYLHSGITMGHLTTMAVWPSVTDSGEVDIRVEYTAGGVPG